MDIPMSSWFLVITYKPLQKDRWGCETISYAFVEAISAHHFNLFLK